MYVVNVELCTGCETCVDVCPSEAIAMVDGKAFINDECIDCASCESECPEEAISAAE